MTTPNTNTPPPALVSTVEKNGLKFDLVRDETKAKADKEATCFWNIPAASVLAGFTDADKALLLNEKTPAEQAEPLRKRCLDAYVTLLGTDKALEYIEARLNVTMRTAQLEAGKDNWDMPTKLTKAIAYIGEGDFGRNRQGGVAGLANKLKDAQETMKQQSALLVRLMAASQKQALATTDADRAAAQAELLTITAEMQNLTK